MQAAALGRQAELDQHLRRLAGDEAGARDRRAGRIHRPAGRDRGERLRIGGELAGDGERQAVGELCQVGRVGVLAAEEEVGGVHVGIADLRAPGGIERGVVHQRLHAELERLRGSALIERLEQGMADIGRDGDEIDRHARGRLAEGGAVLADGEGDGARPGAGGEGGIETVVFVVQPDDRGRRRFRRFRQGGEIGIERLLLGPVGKTGPRRLQPGRRGGRGQRSGQECRAGEGRDPLPAKERDLVGHPVEAEQPLDFGYQQGGEPVGVEEGRVGLAADEDVQQHAAPRLRAAGRPARPRHGRG